MYTTDTKTIHKQIRQCHEYSPAPLHCTCLRYLRVLLLRVGAHHVRGQLACEARVLLLQGARVAGRAVIVAL